MECIVCRSSVFAPHLKQLQKCSSCGHVTADMDIEGFEGKDLYTEGYFLDGEYDNYIRDQFCYEKNFRQRLETVLKYAPQGRLLEIGSAYGFFLNLARENFSCVGYEICPEAAVFARESFGLDVREGDFLNDRSLPDSSVDVAVLWDVIEHLPNPHDFLDKIHGLLKTGGVIALTTGDIASLAAKLQRDQWRLIHPPTHIHYFSKQILSRLLEDHGFKVLDVTYPGYWRSWKQMIYGLSGNTSRVSRFLSDHGLYINLYDIMQVIARK